MPLNKEIVLTLLNTPEIGPAAVKKIKLIATHEINSIPELYELIKYAKNQNPHIVLPDLKILIESNKKANVILNQCENENIKLLLMEDNFFPIRLRRLDDCPLLLFVKGNYRLLNPLYSVAIIGTREPSNNGYILGKKISNFFGNSGFTIISGLAAGCDSAAHIGALEAKAPTIAVFAGGVNYVYPKENKYLAEKILNNDGIIISEYGIDTKPQQATFINRDRIQSGLSDGIVVVETDTKGGTMHTVNYAQKLKLPIGCLANYPEYKMGFSKTLGNKLLISSGAFVLDSLTKNTEFMSKLKHESFIINNTTNENLNSLKDQNKFSYAESFFNSLISIYTKEKLDDIEIELSKIVNQNIGKSTQNEGVDLFITQNLIIKSLITDINFLKNELSKAQVDINKLQNLLETQVVIQNKLKRNENL